MKTCLISTGVALCLQIASSFAAETCTIAAAPNVPVISGLDYDHARALLLAAGWQPGHGTRFVDMAGNQTVFHDRGFTELQSCSMDAAASCRFNFNGRGNTVLHITTEGEENPVLETKAVVRRAELGCED